jgi:membrane protease YdiL (CAAX protease family)
MNDSTQSPSATLTGRARALGLLVLFVGIYLTYLAVVTAITPARGMVIDTLIVLAGAIATGWFLLVVAEKRPWRELGIAVRRQTPREVGAGFAIPCIALLLIMGTLMVVRELIYGPDEGNFAAWLAGCAQLLLILAVPAAAEEALFRGYPFLKLVEAIGPRLATVLASAGFAFAHRHNPGVEGFALINIFVAGMMLSFAFLKTRSLWFVTAIHLGWNWAMAGPLDLPVSGLELFDTPMYEVIALGNPGWTGGGFGPEGGVSGLLALLLVTVAVWFYTKQKTLSND